MSTYSATGEDNHTCQHDKQTLADTCRRAEEEQVEWFPIAK